MFYSFSEGRPYLITQKDARLFDSSTLPGDGANIEFGHVKVMQKVINQEN